MLADSWGLVLGKKAAPFPVPSRGGRQTDDVTSPFPPGSSVVMAAFDPA
jgi:hypothetical protein